MSKGWMDEIDVKKLSAFAGKGNVRVGIFSDTQDYKDDGQPVPDGYISKIIMVAYIHEYGLGVVRRPWLGASFKKDKKKHDKWMIKALRKSVDNKNKRKKQLKKLGIKAVESVQDHIEDNDIGLAANEEATIKQKGGNSPLIETRHFIRHIDYRIGK